MAALHLGQIGRLLLKTGQAMLHMMRIDCLHQRQVGGAGRAQMQRAVQERAAKIINGFKAGGCV